MYSRQRSMGTKKELVHEMRSKDAFRREFRCAVAHTCSQLPGVEPHATLVASPGSCCAFKSLDPLGVLLHHPAIKATKSHAKLGYTSPWPSRAVSQLKSSKFCIPAILIGSPHQACKMDKDSGQRPKTHRAEVDKTPSTRASSHASHAPRVGAAPTCCTPQ